MNKDKETDREYYLRQFSRVNNRIDDVFGKGTIEVGEKIVELLKKEDLTHDGAYASLQYAYNKIQYESNFLKLN
ncbi:hypothetical protein [Pediococcus stilesii]|uniref:Uncharacterized protein n=1 Tax=Pediococcus stilesii TaxID=331679 RepID=A0A0R2L6M8_9LACO|nr:hypothetical protein [Pediococcus stilesii]KRN94557.1 hypothetical protein IV81_GL001190 [Pediococcus stilesii]